MKTKLFALLVGIVPVVLAAGPSAAAPQVAPQPADRAPAPAPVVKAKQAGALKVEKVTGVHGETKTLEAVLESGGKPLAGKSVVFRIEGKDGTKVPGGVIQAGSGATDATGKARVSFKLPELPQGSYALKASFAGDADTLGANGEANLFAVKAPTKIELSDMFGFDGSSSTQKIVSVALVRTSDGNALPKQLTVTVNGKSWTLYASAGAHHQVLLPTDAKKWDVKVQFEGDDANLATIGQRTYAKS